MCVLGRGCGAGGGGEGSVVSTLIGSKRNLMHTVLKMPSAVIARAMGWNCSIVSVNHLSQSQLVGHTNTSPPELGGGGGWSVCVWGGGRRLVASFSCQLPTDIAD